MKRFTRHARGLRMADESPQVRLPGRLYRKCGRWWWKVRLPGAKAARSRALRPPGRRLATADRQLAQEIAFSIWQKALQAEAEAAVKAEQAVQTLRRKRHFRQKVKRLTDAAEKAEARARAEAKAKVKLQAALDALTAPPAEPGGPPAQKAPCECCGCHVSLEDLRRIDSGQQLCRQCLDELHRAVQRQPSEGRRTENARSKTASSSIPNFSFEDPLHWRNAHGPHVLYTQAGRR
jgi:hypothetical protein